MENLVDSLERESKTRDPLVLILSGTILETLIGLFIVGRKVDPRFVQLLFPLFLYICPVYR